MIEVKNLVKWYGNKKALKDVSFIVNDGEVLGFLGPNGAGKTTTMNIITGYLSSTSGKVMVDDAEILDDPLTVKKKIGYLPETPPLYVDMTVSAYLSFMFDLKKVKGLSKKEHLEEISRIVGVNNVCERLIKNLSKGYKQRVGLAAALIGYPPVLILDEPTVGLDPKQIIEIRNLIKGFGKKHTVMLSSHVLSEIQAVCDRVLVINEGEIVANDTPENLAMGIDKSKKMLFKIDGDETEILKQLQELEGVINVKFKGQSEENAIDFEVEFNANTDIRRPVALAMNSIGAIVLSTSEIQMSLEDVFLKLTDKNSAGSIITEKAIDADKAQESDKQDETTLIEEDKAHEADNRVKQREEGDSK